MKLADDVYGIELPGSNAYLLLGARHILIDTGMPGHGNELLTRLDQILPAAHTLDEVLLTHHDVDHIGNLHEVQKRYSIGAYMSSEDLPFAEGKKRRPGIKRIIERVIRPRMPFNLRPLEDYRNPEIKVIPLPGHTPGHTVFQFRDLLFTGDLFHTEKGHITPTKKMMNWDNRMLSDSIGKLLEMDVAALCPAHGDPVEFSASIKKECKELGDFLCRKIAGSTKRESRC